VARRSVIPAARGSRSRRLYSSAAWSPAAGSWPPSGCGPASSWPGSGAVPAGVVVIAGVVGAAVVACAADAARAGSIVAGGSAGRRVEDADALDRHQKGLDKFATSFNCAFGSASPTDTS
jgi:hypothetical protein